MISTLLREPARIAALRATPDGLRRLRANSAARISQCQKYPAMMRRHWDAVQKMADDIVLPVEDYKPYFSLLLSMIDLCLGSTEALREGLEEAGTPANDLSTLVDAAASLRSLRAEASGVWDWMTSPPAKLSLPTTAEVRAAIARGESITIEEAIAQAGGPIFSVLSVFIEQDPVRTLHRLGQSRSEVQPTEVASSTTGSAQRRRM